MAKSIDKAVNSEMDQFQSDLLRSVRQMKAGKAARTTVIALTPAAEAQGPRQVFLSPNLQPCWVYRCAPCKTGSKADANPRGRPRRCCGLQRVRQRRSD